MKRRIVIIFCIILAILMILSALSPVLFAETVQSTAFAGDVLPLGMEIIIGTAAGVLILIILLRVILSIIKKKND
ncbi:hypothetical protein [Acetanaerobacterium elongatum]|uniref:Uncharacterized protein n=1 Tax=Acetanaerobacterium elongatum TaxID=258515 RepID=A0A1G9VHI0_9FIRM|nr:hypothetical protein [Acetanaerobacterium elongatum]SDM71599.1 hypothetical protein SAMN05192585_1049 [Acetanaerobacterium elongatum]